MVVSSAWCLSAWVGCWLVSHPPLLLRLPSFLKMGLLMEIVVFLHSHHGLNMVLVLQPGVVVLHFALCQALSMGGGPCGHPLTWTYARGFVFFFPLRMAVGFFLQCNLSFF